MLEAAERALKQIEEKEYAAELFQHGIKTAVAFGIACEGKKILVKSMSSSMPAPEN